MIVDVDNKILNRVIDLQRCIRNITHESINRQSHEDLTRIAEEGAGDVVYGIDKPGEEFLASYCKGWAEQDGISFVLISEATGKSVFPEGTSEEDAEYRVIVDPIDGTRPLMYDLDSAWVLTGVAENKGEETSLEDIEIVVQTEIPRTYDDRSFFISCAFNSKPRISFNLSASTSILFGLKSGVVILLFLY